MDNTSTSDTTSQRDLSNIVRAEVEELQKIWDNLYTDTVYSQQECEEKCAHYLIPFHKLDEKERERLLSSGLVNELGEFQFIHSKHVNYLHSLSGSLGPAYSSQASSYFVLPGFIIYRRPWLCYHVLNSLALLGEEPRINREGALHSLDICRTMQGGYAGSYNEVDNTVNGC